MLPPFPVPQETSENLLSPSPRLSYPLTTILCMARITTFRFALDLSSGQERDCYRFAGAARKAFNWGLGEVKATMKLRHDQLQESGRSDTLVPLTRNALIPAFNAFKLSPEGEQDGIAFWYDQVSKFCFEEGLVDLSRGLASWRNGRAGFPRFKKKGRAKASFRLRPSTPTDIRFGTEQNSRKVRLPRLGWLKVHDDTRALRRLLRPGKGGSPRSKILQATISRGGRRWYLCLAVEAPDLHPARRMDPAGDQTFVGVDLGLYSFAVVADDQGNLIESLPAPAPLKRGLRKLRRLSKACSRTQPGSSGRRKSNRRLARHHERIATVRPNFAHQLSCRLANTHGRMAVETLNVAGMVRNRRLARSISDGGWGGFVSMLCYKADWGGVPGACSQIPGQLKDLLGVRGIQKRAVSFGAGLFLRELRGRDRPRPQRRGQSCQVRASRTSVASRRGTRGDPKRRWSGERWQCRKRFCETIPYETGTCVSGIAEKAAARIQLFKLIRGGSLGLVLRLGDQPHRRHRHTGVEPHDPNPSRIAPLP